MTRIIVTGATGFIGRYCVAELVRQGFDVIGFTSQHHPMPTPGVTWQHVNLFDVSQMHDAVQRCQASHMLHLAWETTPSKFWNDPINLVWKSVSVELCRAFVAAGGTRFVGVGSCAEYDWNSGRCCEQATPLRPNTLYGKCKNEARAACEDIANDAGVSFGWARLFHLYGPGAPLQKMPALLIESLLDEQPVDCTAGTQLLDFLHIADAARGVTDVLTSNFVGPVNVAAGVARPLRAVMSLVGEELSCPELIRFAAKPQAGHEPQSIEAATERIQNAIGWTPEFDLETGIRATIDWHTSLRRRRAA